MLSMDVYISQGRVPGIKIKGVLYRLCQQKNVSLISNLVVVHPVERKVGQIWRKEANLSYEEWEER
jgi:hypothetical protein